MGAPNWVNRTVWTGDNLDIMRGMNDESVDLIYLDPPFNSNRNYAAPIGSKAAGAAFKDTWYLSDLDEAWMGLIADTEPDMYQVVLAARLAHGKGMQSYLCMMAVRLTEMRRVLKPTGTIYLHCDHTASHYLKTLMDVVFGKSNFRNEIVWCYTGPGSPNMKNFPRKHDTILRYTAGDEWTWNGAYVPYAPGFIGKTKKTDKNIWGPSDVEDLKKREERGKQIEDWWSDIPSSWYMKKAEKTNYPTQKPLALLDRIIQASSNEGDVVFDPFCGCATALVSAEMHVRQWIGIDLSEKAVQLVVERLRDQNGLFGDVIHRTDIPKRNDTLDVLLPKKERKHVLFGKQEGVCNGCKYPFEYRHLEIDHIVPQAKGGGDHMENLQLLCGHCNKTKGKQSMEYLIARLSENEYLSTQTATA